MTIKPNQSNKEKPYLKICANGTTKIIGVKNPKVIKAKDGQIINYET